MRVVEPVLAWDWDLGLALAPAPALAMEASAAVEQRPLEIQKAACLRIL